MSSLCRVHHLPLSYSLAQLAVGVQSREQTVQQLAAWGEGVLAGGVGLCWGVCAGLCVCLL